MTYLPEVCMVSPGSRGTWFWNILTCAPYLRAERFCTEHRAVSGATTASSTCTTDIYEYLLAEI